MAISEEAIRQIDDETAVSEVIRPGLQGRVLRLAWPVIGENLLQTLLGIVDTLLVARLGAAAIAGVGIGFQLTFFLIAIISAVTIGSSILVSYAFGSRQGATANQLARQALTWGALISVPVSVLSVLFADAMASAFGVTSDVAVIAADYWRVVSGTSIFLIIMLAAGAVLRGAGDSRSPMYATLLANVINAVMAYVLIFGNFGFPEMGPVGSAWAATLGRMAGAIMLLAILFRGRGPLSIRGRVGWWPDLAIARRISRLGLPAATEQIITSLSFVALTVVVAKLGTDALAAQRLTFTALSLAFIPGIGFGIAATALVGQSLGGRRPAEAAAASDISTWWGAIWMGTIGLVFAFVGAPIMRLFSDDPTIINFGVESFRVIAIATPFFAIMFIQAGSLRGAGNTKFPLWANAIGFWSAVGMGALAVGPLNLGLPGLWGAYTIMAPILAFVLWRRFRRRDWQHEHLATGRVPMTASEL